jgi:hypothetical protein
MNMADRDLKGRGRNPPLHMGENHPRAKVTDYQVEQIRAARNESGRALAQEFGISESQVSAIRTGASRNGR